MVTINYILIIGFSHINHINQAQHLHVHSKNGMYPPYYMFWLDN
jgi:hypothetical protein